MNKLLLSVLCLLAVFAAVVPCLADTVNGVLAEERIVNLPNDQGKWYVSVVGNAADPRYNEIVGWFDTNASLKKLKDQVHFCPVTSDTAIYQARYACNVTGLPTVRMQKADGTVVYEAAGKNLPMTAAGLNGALAGAVSTAQGIRPVLPWRRDMERQCPGPLPGLADQHEHPGRSDSRDGQRHVGRGQCLPDVASRVDDGIARRGGMEVPGRRRPGRHGRDSGDALAGRGGD